MSGRISPVGALPATAATAQASPVHAAPGSPDAKRAEKLHHAAHEFESLFVKQLLTTAKIMGEGKSSGYADMAVDALTTGIEKAGGLGLGRRIEDALSPTVLHANPPPRSPSVR